MSTWPRDPVTKRFLKRSEIYTAAPPNHNQAPQQQRDAYAVREPEPNRRLTLSDLARIADEANARLEAARKQLAAAEQELADAELAQQNATFALKNRL